jgi:mannose-6-phosphate isomerase-like protein (cupin superfamily)
MERPFGRREEDHLALALMADGYRLVTSGTRIPVPGDKFVEELFGAVNTGTKAFSLAHMISPPGWGEPFQRPEFGELTIMTRGTMQIELPGEKVELAAGQAIWIEPGVRVRYSNPYPGEGEYYAVCIPAFSPSTVHREG